MRPLAVFLVLVLATPALAGCVQIGDLGDRVRDRLAPESGYAMDCSVNTAPDLWPDACTARASWNEAPSKTEIDLAVNPRDPLNVIVGAKDLDRNASECVWSVLQVTKDGGKTWKTVYVGGDSANREPMLRPFACVTDPIMVFDDAGVAYYALQAYRLGTGPENVPNLPTLGQPIVGSTFILARSTDGGETWDQFVLQHAADGVAVFHDYPRMLVNPATQSVHTIWNGVGRGGVTPWVSTSRDGGESVDRPVTFYHPQAPRSTRFYSGFDATTDGTIFVTTAVTPSQQAFTGGGSDNVSVHLFASRDDARTFAHVGHMFNITPTPRQLETNEFRSPSFVELAIDRSEGPHQGRLYAFWPDYSNASTTGSDVKLSWSGDGGLTWSAPIDVASDRTNDQLMMRPTVGADGTVHVLFYSRAWDPENRLLDAVHAWSTDGGATWSDQRLTGSSFDGDLGVHQNGYPFIGDYNGIKVASDGAVYAAWGDTRTGVAEVAFARILPKG